MQFFLTMTALFGLLAGLGQDAPATKPDPPEVLVVRRRIAAFGRAERAFRAKYPGKVVGTVILDEKKAKLAKADLAPLGPSGVVLTIGTVALREAQSVVVRSRRIAALGTLGLVRESRTRWYHPLDLSPERRLERCLDAVGRVTDLGMYLGPALDKRRERGLVALAKKRGLRLHIRRIDHPAQSVTSLASFPREVRLVVLLPDPKTTPWPGRRLDRDLERALTRRGVFVFGLSPSHLHTRSILHLQADLERMAEEIATAISTGAGSKLVGPSRYRAVSHPKIKAAFEAARGGREGKEKKE